MTFYELVDVAQSVGGRLDVQWGFFITIHMALLGSIFFVDRPVPDSAKIAGTFVYVVFAIANFRALRLHHEILERTYAEIAALKDDPCCVDNALMDFYVGEVAANFGTRMLVVASILHVAAFAVFVLSLFAIRARIKSSSGAD